MSTLFYIVEAAVKAVFVLFAIAFPLASLLIWQERKQSALIQDRLGPNRAFINLPFIRRFRFFGLLHLVADSIKMFMKEDFMPAGARPFLFQMAPVLALAPVLLVFAVIPFGDTLLLYLPDKDLFYAVNLSVASLDTGLLFLLAVISLTVYGTVLAGYAPDSKPGMLGALRAGAQMFSYEAAMGLTVAGVLMVYGTMAIDHIARAQDSLVLGFLPAWGVVYQPLGALLFLIAATAETKRVPFDMPEGESEIVGYFVEYSAMKFGTFMFAEFLEVVAVAALLTVLFFGAYHLPWLSWNHHVIPWLTGLIGAHTVTPGLNIQVVSLVTALLQLLVFMAKVGFFCFLQLLVRWTLPRFRYDQLMDFGWKLLLPAAMINLALTAVAVLALGKAG